MGCQRRRRSGPGGAAAMSAPWHEEDEESRMGGARGALKAKPRFSFTEVKVLLEAVKRNRYILLSELCVRVCVCFK